MHFDFHMWLVMSTIWSSTLQFKIVGSFEFSLLLQFAFDIEVVTLNTCKFHLCISAEFFSVQTRALWYVVMSTIWSSILGFNISGSLNLISFWIWLHLKFFVWEIFSWNFILFVLHVFFYLHFHKMWAHFFSCWGHHQASNMWSLIFPLSCSCGWRLQSMSHSSFFVLMCLSYALWILLLGQCYVSSPFLLYLMMLIGCNFEVLSTWFKAKIAFWCDS